VDESGSELCPVIGGVELRVQIPENWAVIPTEVRVAL
jgi:hypothetical protein